MPTWAHGSTLLCTMAYKWGEGQDKSSQGQKII